MPRPASHSPAPVRALLVLAIFAAALAAAGPLRAQESRGDASGELPERRRPAVGRCTLTGTVDAGSAAYLQDCVVDAEVAGYDALLVRIDTPGGALESTRAIVRSFLGAEVPVLVWVGPSGARAGSAGVFVTLAANAAGMAPGTNIGAAHPVVGPTGQDPEEAGGKAMGEKVLNDTIAFVESIAQQRGRNVEWAVKAVRESASVPAERAVELNVVDVVAPTEEAFLAAVDGRTVELPSGEVVLRTANARIVELEPSLGQRLVHWLANPSIAYLLFVLGGLGLAIELSNPGMIVPGLLGAICIILALVAFSALPVQAGAIALMLVGIGLIVAELFVASGLLGVGGMVLLVLGGVLLVDDVDFEWFVEPSFGISLGFLIPTVVVLGAGAVYLLVRAAEARTIPQLGGDVGLLGERGRALSAIGPGGGEVFVHGERWRAISVRPIAAGAPVAVRNVDGLTLTVEEIV
ncbi:NfeD family protein [Vulgatibacter sp.]|uniref:NfeD family protein n=1 Tax=Vulgatibacter sp. TaxID=1971226 RepID=UPI003561D1AF